MGTRDWGRAEQRLKTWSANPEGAAAAADATPASKFETVSSSVARFLSDCERRNIAEGTRRTYRSVLDSFADHCERHGETAIGEVSIQTVRDFHIEPRESTRPVKGTHGKELQKIVRIVKPTTAVKELETLRTFFNWLIDEGTVTASPAKKVKPPVMSEDPDEDADPKPFSQNEVDLIFMAAGELQNNNQGAVEPARRRAKAIVYLMLYSGLRISDVAAFARRSVNLKDGRFKVRTMKSRHKTIVRGKLPPAACEALTALPVQSSLFFASGKSKSATTRGSIRRTIDAIMRIAGIQNGNPHRFRHTFATRLFENGARVEQVAAALGHTDPRITIKHYKHWIPELQEQSDALLDTLNFDGSAVRPAGMSAQPIANKRRRNTKGNVIAFTARTA